jgi:hypothetical protein
MSDFSPGDNVLAQHPQYAEMRPATVVGASGGMAPVDCVMRPVFYFAFENNDQQSVTEDKILRAP